MRHIFVILVFVLSLIALESSFITPSEYAKMLYQNPHGIGCDHCHGINGEGGIIAQYTQYDKKNKKNIKVDIVAPSIVGVDYEKFKNALSNPKSIMPSYSLTNNEAAALYMYVNKLFQKVKR